MMDILKAIGLTVLLMLFFMIVGILMEIIMCRIIDFLHDKGILK